MYVKTGDHYVWCVITTVRFTSKYDFPLIPIIYFIRSSQHYRDENGLLRCKYLLIIKIQSR